MGHTEVSRESNKDKIRTTAQYVPLLIAGLLVLGTTSLVQNVVVEAFCCFRILQNLKRFLNVCPGK